MTFVEEVAAGIQHPLSEAKEGAFLKRYRKFIHTELKKAAMKSGKGLSKVRTFDVDAFRDDINITFRGELRDGNIFAGSLSFIPVDRLYFMVYGNIEVPANRYTNTLDSEEGAPHHFEQYVEDVLTGLFDW